MNSNRVCYIYKKNIYAGILSETDEGYSFIYDKSYLSLENPGPVSLTLPLTEKEYHSTTLFPFFDGLIPEGWLLDAVCHNWKINKKDRFGILLVSCKDPIGDVSIRESLEVKT